MKCFGVLALVMHPFVFGFACRHLFLCCLLLCVPFFRCLSLSRSLGLSAGLFSLSQLPCVVCWRRFRLSSSYVVTGGKRRDQRLSRLLSKRVLMLFRYKKKRDPVFGRKNCFSCLPIGLVYRSKRHLTKPVEEVLNPCLCYHPQPNLPTFCTTCSNFSPFSIPLRPHHIHIVIV